jgi:UDP-galactopyranose mutase
MKFLIVGAGFAGGVYARELAEAGHTVDVIDSRNHIAGNAYDYVNKDGIRVHKYGPHIFHTSNMKVVDWLSKFTDWITHEHKVLAKHTDGDFYVLPPNRDTVARIGKENIIDVFFRPYTKKMWEKEIEELNPKILERVPIRDDDNELYFPNDDFQKMPVDGYTALFERIFDHENITVKLDCLFDKSMENEYDHVFNSMPIDQYYDYEFGGHVFVLARYKGGWNNAPVAILFEDDEFAPMPEEMKAEKENKIKIDMIIKFTWENFKTT